LLFAFISHRSFPRVVRAKPLLVAALILAGCGGGGNGKWQQVQGNGFSYDAPASWVVDGSAATSGAVDRVEVLVFRLLRPYARDRRAAVGRELDRDAANLARQLKGSVSSRSWLEAGGADARSYEIAYSGRFSQITFVLDGRREFQLLCRRRAGADVSPCTQLLRSFRIG
jgi:hypothetical protein